MTFNDIKNDQMFRYDDKIYRKNGQDGMRVAELVHGNWKLLPKPIRCHFDAATKVFPVALAFTITGI